MSAFNGGDDISVLIPFLENENAKQIFREKVNKKCLQKYQPLSNGKYADLKNMEPLVTFIVLLEKEIEMAEVFPANPLAEMKVRVKRQNTKVEEVLLGKVFFP